MKYFFVTALLIAGLVSHAQSNINSQSISATFQDYSNSSSQPTGSRVSTLPEFHPAVITKGSRYLFDDWVHGTVTKVNDTVINSDKILYNYDKIGSKLLFTEDKAVIAEADDDQIKSFTLTGNDGKPTTYERISLTGKMQFAETVAKGANFSFYKLSNTKFIKNNYHTDGLTETGHDYDEYTTESDYYMVTNGAAHKFDLKSKSIKAVLSSDAKKVNDYFSQHSSDDIDDSFLSGLIAYLNQ